MRCTIHRAQKQGWSVAAEPKQSKTILAYTPPHTHTLQNTGRKASRDLISNCTTHPYTTFSATAQHERDSPIFSQSPSGLQSPLSQADLDKTSEATTSAGLLSIIGRPRPEAFKGQSSFGFQFFSKLPQIRRRAPAQKLFYLVRKTPTRSNAPISYHVSAWRKWRATSQNPPTRPHDVSPAPLLHPESSLEHHKQYATCHAKEEIASESLRFSLFHCQSWDQFWSQHEPVPRRTKFWHLLRAPSHRKILLPIAAAMLLPWANSVLSATWPRYISPWTLERTGASLALGLPSVSDQHDANRPSRPQPTYPWPVQDAEKFFQHQVNHLLKRASWSMSTIFKLSNAPASTEKLNVCSVFPSTLERGMA